MGVEHIWQGDGGVQGGLEEGKGGRRREGVLSFFICYWLNLITPLFGCPCVLAQKQTLSREKHIVSTSFLHVLINCKSEYCIFAFGKKSSSKDYKGSSNTTILGELVI